MVKFKAETNWVNAQWSLEEGELSFPLLRSLPMAVFSSVALFPRQGEFSPLLKSKPSWGPSFKTLEVVISVITGYDLGWHSEEGMTFWGGGTFWCSSWQQRGRELGTLLVQTWKASHGKDGSFRQNYIDCLWSLSLNILNILDFWRSLILLKNSFLFLVRTDTITCLIDLLSPCNSPSLQEGLGCSF